MNDFEQDAMPEFIPGSTGIEAKSSGHFQPRLGTYLLLIFLLVIWPAVNLSIMFIDTPEIDWNRYDPVYYLFLPTVILHWLIFLAVALGLFREASSFESIGFVRIRFKDLLYALGFLILSNIILSLLQVLLAPLGLTISQDVNAIVGKARESTWWWLAVSVTAAICEETAFRGYILTRVRGIFPRGGWMFAVILSTVAFASGHGYQGVAGLILLFIYGLLFCGLYLYTRSLWPCVLAHFIQDFSAIFLYDFMDF